MPKKHYYIVLKGDNYGYKGFTLFFNRRQRTEHN